MRPLITLRSAGYVTEPPDVPPPEALFVNWPVGTLATFWWLDPDGNRVIHSVETGFSDGSNDPGKSLARRSAVQFRRWPERLDYVFLERIPGTSQMHHIDILNGSHQLIPGAHGGPGYPYAHTDGSFYWRETNLDDESQALVRWSPEAGAQVVAVVPYAGAGSLQSNGEAAHRDVFVIADPSPVVHLVDYATGAVETRPRSATFRQLTDALGIPIAADLDRLPGAIGSSWACPRVLTNGSGQIRGSWLSSVSGYLVDIQPGCTGDANSAIGSAPRHVAGHMSQARDLYLVYPFDGDGSPGDPYRSKVFDLSQPASAPENSNPNVGDGVPPRLLEEDPSTQPDQVWLWGPPEASE